MEPAHLVSDQLVTRSSPGEDVHSFSFAMEKQRFAYLELEQRGVDVRLDLFDPHGKKLFSHDIERGSFGVEVIGFIAEYDGSYRLEIAAMDPEERGGYVLRLRGPHVPDTADRARARASLNIEAARKAWDKQDREEAARELETAGRMLNGAGEQAQRARVLNKLGTIYIKQGRFEEAIDYYDAALAIRGEPDLYRAEILQNKAYAYRFVGACKEAIALLEEAEKIQQVEGTNRSWADWYDHIGTTYLKCNQAESAIPYLEQAFTLGGERLSSLVSMRLAQAYDQTGRYEQALSIYGKLIEELPASRETWRPALLYYRGLTLYHLGEHERALTHLRKAAAGFKRAESYDELFNALLACARAERGLGNGERALEDVASALELLEEARASARSSILNQNYLAFRYAGFDLLVDLVLEKGGETRVQRLLARLDRFRARGLVETLPRSGPEPDPDLAGELRELSKRISNAEWRRAATSLSAERKDELEREINILLIRYERVLTRVRNPSEQPARPPAGLDLAGMRALLGERDLLLFYAMGEQRIRLLALDHHSLNSFDLGPRDTIEAEVLEFADFVRRREPEPVHPYLEESRRRLAPLLPQTLLQQTTANRLIIIPDGVLHYLPFAALNDPRADQPLVIRFEIAYLPSMATLAALRRRPRVSKDELAVFADPARYGTFFRALPFAEKEARQILRLAPRTRLYLGTDAGKERALSGVLESSRLIHFATHGLLHPDHHELSALVLAGVNVQNQPRDQFLRVHDIAGLELAAEIAVLSACETGLGEKIRGEGLVGLPQAFLGAGASSVLVSLWGIDDEATMILMRHFYTNLVENGPAEALQMAQRIMSQSERWRAPYYWAGFRFMGDWRVRPGRAMAVGTK